jgi:hypothetical protein
MVLITVDKYTQLMIYANGWCKALKICDVHVD